MEIIEREVEEREIIKSNQLIEGGYNFTISENRLVDLALLKLEVIMLKKELSAEEVAVLIKKAQFKEIEIYVADYKREYNNNNHNIYKELAKSAERLLHRQITYSIPNKLIKKNWVITCIFNDDESSISLQFHPDLIADLLIFKGCYTRFNFDIKKYIKSFYTCRIYELLKQYECYGIRTFTIKKLKFLLGIEENQYPSFSNIRQSVILPAVANLNKTSDLYIEWFTGGKKRKIETVTFKFVKQKINFKPNKKTVVFDSDLIKPKEADLNEIEEFKKLIGVTVGRQQIAQIIRYSEKALKKYKLDITTEEYIKQKKAVVDNYALKHEVPSYLGALIKAIQQNWVLNFKPKEVGAFNNFEQRDYDYDELEARLLGNYVEPSDEVATDADEEPDNEDKE